VQREKITFRNRQKFLGFQQNAKLNYLEKSYYLMNYSYEIKDFDAGGKIGQFKIGDKILDTPNLFPVVSPFDNLVSPKRMYEHFKVQSIFTNAYILYKNRIKNPDIIQKGLHNHLDFPGIIATDSGKSFLLGILLIEESGIFTICYIF